MIYELAKKLFPICRSITGNGVRESLEILKEVCPTLKTYEVKTGTQVFDWTVPKEWNIKDAWIKDSNGKKIIDFKENNLHVMGYSIPVHKKINLDELLTYVYTLPETPGLIPYITSYYSERFGFCMTENLKNSLQKGEYEIFIDSELKDGHLTYGEIIIPGKIEKEIFLSTYICHPSMGNNELSGPCVAIYLAKWLLDNASKNRYTYRIIFIPETIGSITYLSRNLDIMKKNIIAGFVLTCCGDEGQFSYLESPYANTLADKVTKNVLKYNAPNYKTYSFLKRGSDERQYCFPGIDLPVCSVMKTRYGDYPEYHTSGDDLNFISEKGLTDSYEMYKKIITALENNYKYKVNTLCEPQLGKRGLYYSICTKENMDSVENMMNFMTYTDGNNDMIDISNKINVNLEEIYEYADKFLKANLIDIID